MKQMPNVDLGPVSEETIDAQSAVYMPVTIDDNFRERLEKFTESHELVCIHYQIDGKRFGRDGMIESVIENGGKVKIGFRAALYNQPLS